MKNYNMYMPNKNKNNTKHQFETIFLHAGKCELLYIRIMKSTKGTKLHKLKMITFCNQIGATMIYT